MIQDFLLQGQKFPVNYISCVIFDVLIEEEWEKTDGFVLSILWKHGCAIAAT